MHSTAFPLLVEGISSDFILTRNETSCNGTDFIYSILQFTGQNVKIQRKTLRERVLDKDTGPIYGYLKQTMMCMLQSDDTKFYRTGENYMPQEDFSHAVQRPRIGRK